MRDDQGRGAKGFRRRHVLWLLAGAGGVALAGRREVDEAQSATPEGSIWPQLPNVESTSAALSAPLPPSGTCAERYSFAATRFRWPTIAQAAGSNTYFAVEFLFATPEYEVNDPRFFVPSFFCPASGLPEQAVPDFVVQGVSIDISGGTTGAGTWIVCDNAAESGVATISASPTLVDGVVRPTNPGCLLPSIRTTLRPNTLYRGRLSFFRLVPGGVFPRVAAQIGANLPLPQERIEGSITSRFSRLSGSLTGNLSGSGGVFLAPSFMVAKGGDGRPAVLVIGDSIGFGATASSVPATWTKRGEFGYVGVGLDSDRDGRRIPHANFCVPGQRAISSRATDYPWNGALATPTDANWAMKRAALQQVYDLQQAWPFDILICQHAANSLPYNGTPAQFRADFERFYKKLATWFGKPIYQIEPLTKARSLDGFQTLGVESGGNQIPLSGCAIGQQQWLFAADLGGVDGLTPQSGYFVPNGLLAGSIPAWRYGAANVTDDRDLQSISLRSFSTALATAYVGGGNLQLVSAPLVGEILTIPRASDGKFFSVMVAAVKGSGPFDVTPVFAGGQDNTVTALAPANAGATCRAALHDAGGVHPSPVAHDAHYAQALIEWKKAAGVA